MRNFAVLMAGIFLLVAGSLAWGYPEPTGVVRTWQFEFEHRQPQAIAVMDVRGQTQWYWYITYRVTNKTEGAQMFIPEVTVATDEGQIVAANRNVPPQVFSAIKAKDRNPLLERPTNVVGRLLVGEDRAKDSVAIWRAFEGDVSEVDVFFEGLSGETAQVVHPLSGEKVLMRKTRMLRYQYPGDPPSPKLQDVVESDRLWVMR